MQVNIVLHGEKGDSGKRVLVKPTEEKEKLFQEGTVSHVFFVSHSHQRCAQSFVNFFEKYQKLIGFKSLSLNRTHSRWKLST